MRRRATSGLKLIIDARDSGGGDNMVGYAKLVTPVETGADLNARGHQYVLIGPLAVSTAMNSAAQFQDEAKTARATSQPGKDVISATALVCAHNSTRCDYPYQRRTAN